MSCTCAQHPDTHSFPTRRSSYLHNGADEDGCRLSNRLDPPEQRRGKRQRAGGGRQDHKEPPRFRYVVGKCEERRSEEHTSELQSRLHLVCRLLLEKKNDVERGAV